MPPPTQPMEERVIRLELVDHATLAALLVLHRMRGEQVELFPGSLALMFADPRYMDEGAWFAHVMGLN